MSMNYLKYRLITESENKELYLLQSSILSLDTITEADRVLKLSLILMQNPIRDYETAVNLLNDFSLTEVNLQILIVGAEINAVWPVFQPNPFIERLLKIYSKCSNLEKSVITYLKAIDIDNSMIMSHEKHIKVECLLKESLELCDSYVNNYYRLALLSNKGTAKQLMKRALSNVEKVYSTERCEKMEFDEIVSFDYFLKEHILGTTLSQSDYFEIKKFYTSL